MQYKQIIKDAWSFAQDNKSMMKWYALIPAIVSTISTALFIAYQYFAFQKVVTETGQEQSMTVAFFKQGFQYVTEHPKSIWIIIGIVLAVLIFYLFFPSFSQGAMIQLIAKKRKGEEVKIVDGITYGLGSFLPMFEYHLFIRTFSITSVVTESTFILRNLGSDFLRFFLPIFGLVLIVGLVLTLFFTFVEWYIVLGSRSTFSAIQQSSRLVFYNWQHIILMLMLLSLIVFRIILNIVLVFAVPLIVFIGLSFMSSLVTYVVALSIAGGVGLVTLYIAGYLGGTLSVFLNAVWTYIFLELTEQ